MQKLIGEWLNGRATVSKTVGCVFESRLPCQDCRKRQSFFYVKIGEVFNEEKRLSSEKLIIYTDGACSGNPGPGAWAYFLKLGQHEKSQSGFVSDTTNNRMEMMAAIEALSALKYPCKVYLHSDSAYLVRAFHERWYDRWQKNGWRNSAKQPVANLDLWQKLLTLTAKHEVEWIKVKGHADDHYNNFVDELAVRTLRDGVARSETESEAGEQSNAR